MEIRWCLYIVISFGILCPAKPVSLNEVIAAESQQKQLHATTSPKLKDPAAERFSLNKGLKPLTRTPKKFKEIENIIPIGKKTSALKYRKTFQIKSPLKPKRIKHSFGTRFKRKNQSQQSIKRVISGNEKLNKKYIPLLRNLGMLFDNLLGSESGESAELTAKRRRVRYYTDSREILCPCSSKTKPSTGFGSEETTTTSAEVFSLKAPPSAEAATETSHPPTTSDFRRFRQNKNFPILLSRNTIGRWRNNHGVSERSRAAHYRGPERHIPGDHGDSGLSTGVGSHKSDAQDDEENTRRYSRYGTSGVGSWGLLHGRQQTHAARNHTKRKKFTINEASVASNENESSLERSRGVLTKLKRQNKQQVRGDKAKSSKLLSESARGIRRFIPEDKVDTSEHLQSEESEKSELQQNSADDQRVDIGNGQLTEENKETSTRNETVGINNIATISHETEDIRNSASVSHETENIGNIDTTSHETEDINNIDAIYDETEDMNNIYTTPHDTVEFNNIPTVSTESSKTEGPLVFIIDGYSVTRNKNGENKLKEKAIHIRDNKYKQM